MAKKETEVDDDEIEETEVDETAEKAKAIGKDIGVEKEKKPDDTGDEYEIQEEPDERIAKKRSDPEDKKEREKLSNREKRLLRKKRINEKFSEKDAIIEAQAARLAALEAKAAQIDGRLHGINRAEVDKALLETQTVYAQAEAAHDAAFTEGDPAKARRALVTMKEADDRYRQLQGLKQKLEHTPESPQEPREIVLDPIITDKRREWEKRNTWYDAKGSDTDSEVAKAVAGALVKAGYDPKTDDFWDELDERLEGKISETEEPEEEIEEEAPKIKRRSAPPVGGGSARGDLKGKKTITLPTSYINTLKANGIYDDPVRMKKILADRARILKESGQ